MKQHDDTIVALSTPRGSGAISIVRLSGPDALRVIQRHVSGVTLTPRRACHTSFYDGDQLIDDTITTYYQAPHSYTGEDMVEVACHGSVYIQQKVVETLLHDPEVRLATAGEFTQRAFLQGRLDLSQAEAVADLIASQSPQSHRLAIDQLRGGVSRELKDLRERLVDLTSLLELELDFSEEDVTFADRTELLSLVDTLLSKVDRLTGSFRLGNALKQGIPVSIVGCPNAGKSTLLNALLNDDRAIVSPQAGTTRDTIEELFTIDGITFRFIDTAGLRQTTDIIEQHGVQRSMKAIADSTIVLYLVPCDQDEAASRALLQTLQSHTAGKSILLLHTKVDLLQQPVETIDDSDPDSLWLSAQTGQGMDTLRRRMVALVTANSHYGDEVMITNVRHYEALCHVQQSLRQVHQSITNQIPADLIAVDIREALYYLGSITGQIVNDEILSSIFGKFCIGK